MKWEIHSIDRARTNGSQDVDTLCVSFFVSVNFAFKVVRIESARPEMPMLTRSDGSPPLDRVRGSAWAFYTPDLSYLQAWHKINGPVQL